MYPVLLDSSFLIDLERELEAGMAGKAVAWLRKARGKKQRALLVSCVSIAEVLEGSPNKQLSLDFLGHFVPQSIGHQHALKCADIQCKSAERGKRFSENDAWQLSFAACAKASIVGRDTRAFEHLGKKYEVY